MTIYGHDSHHGHMIETISTKFMFPLPKEDIKFGFDWPSGFREKDVHNGHLHVYSPRAEADNTLGSNCFQNYKSSVNLVMLQVFTI